MAVVFYEQNTLNHLQLFLNGIMAGIILWTKYSLLGFYFAFGIAILINGTINRQTKKAIKDALVYISGIVAVTIPCVLYFAVNHALSDLINAYLINNISSYGNAISLKGTLLGYYDTVIWELRWSPLFFCSLVISAFCILIFGNKQSKYYLLLMGIFQYLFVFSHGAMFNYYLFAFAVFVIFGVAYFSKFLAHLIKRLKIKCYSLKIAATVGICVISVITAFDYKPFPNEFLKNKYDLAQYQFAKIMNSETEKPTLMQYDSMDAGFFTAADIVPSTWAYCKLNVKNDAMVQDQLNTIKNKSVDYIVLSAQSTVPDILDENYELEAEKSQIVVNAPVTWRLYKRRK